MEQNDKRPGTMICIIMGIAFIAFIAFMLSMLPSCTSTITMVHTEGEASDVVDEVAKNTAEASLSVPLQALPQ